MLTIKDFFKLYNDHYSYQDLRVEQKDGYVVLYVADKNGDPIDDGVILELTPQGHLEIFHADDVSLTHFDGKLAVSSGK